MLKNRELHLSWAKAFLCQDDGEMVCVGIISVQILKYIFWQWFILSIVLAYCHACLVLFGDGTVMKAAWDLLKEQLHSGNLE